MRRIPHRAAFLRAALLLACCAGTVPAATPPEGGLRGDTPADFAPAADPGRTHSEFWTWQFRFQDGMQAQLNISRAHFGKLKDPVCGADLALMGFRGRNHFVAREYPLSNFAWDPSAGRLAVHAGIFAEGVPPRAHRVHFATRKAGTSYFLDLTFEAMAPGVAWGDGVFRLGKGEEVALFLHVPRARVRGRVGVDGDTVSVQGVAWMDHTRQTQFGTKFMDASYRVATTSGRITAGHFFRDGARVFGYGVREQADGSLALLKPETITARESEAWGPAPVPRRLEIGMEGGGTLRVERTEDRQRTSVLQELGGLERMGARMFLGGELIGYRGAARVDDQPGIFAYTIVKR